MDNKHFLTLALVLITIIALVGCYFLSSSAHENTS